MFKHTVDDEIDNSKGESTDNEANNSIENGVFGFFGLTGITRRSYVLETTDNDEDDGNNAGDTNYDIKDAFDSIKKSIWAGTTTASGFFDFGGSVGFTDIISEDGNSAEGGNANEAGKN